MALSLSAILGSEAKAPPKTAAKAPYDEGLEGLRGLAALTVVFHHLFCDSRLDGTYALPGWMLYLHFAHAGVLLFFVLSGYVIGLTTRGEATPQAIKTYLHRRAVRIVPIYLLALLLSVAVLGEFAWGQILYHLAFLQRYGSYLGLVTAYPISSNPALWSLHYEAFFYVGFIAVWLWRPRWGVLMGGALLLALTALIVNARLSLLWSLGCGSFFWLGGLWLAWHAPYQQPDRTPISMVSMLLLLMASMHLATGSLGLSHLDLSHPSNAMVRLEDLAFFPLAMLMVGEVTGRQLPWRRLFVVMAYGIPVLAFIALMLMGRSLFSNTRFSMSVMFYGLSLAAIFVRWPIHRLPFLVFIGSISYGLYVVHMPLIVLAGKLIEFNGTWWMHVGVAGVVILASVGLATILEKVLQPRLREWLVLEGKQAEVAPAAKRSPVPAFGFLTKRVKREKTLHR